MPRIPYRKTFKIIRLALHGCTNRPFYHVVLSLNTRWRDREPFEQLGTYDPMPNIHNEKLVTLDIERIKYHLANDVEVSKPVAKLLGLSGILPVHPMSYITAQRNRRKNAEADAQQETAQDTEDTSSQS